MVAVNPDRAGSPMAFADAVRVWHSALEAAGCPDRLAAEPVSLLEAAGRYPAHIARTKKPCPTYRAAAMDGFAVRTLDVSGASPNARVRLRLDESAVPIDTGGAMPDGFDAVIPIERVVVEGTIVTVDAPSAPGKHVRLPGEDVPPGVAIGWPGIALRPLDCAALVASGCTIVGPPERQSGAARSCM